MLKTLSSLSASLKSAVEARWACEAMLVQTLPVSARLDGQKAWHVVVHVFDLDECAKATRAYAWRVPSAEKGAEPREFLALHIGPIKSPSDAVWAAVADDVRARRLATRGPAAHEAGPSFPVRTYRRRARLIGR
jgi:hypothetical protein